MLKAIEWTCESSKNASTGGVGEGDRARAPPPAARSARPRTPVKARIRKRAIASPLPALEHELEPENAAPECSPVRYGIPIRVFDMFPDGVDLHLDEAVQRPVDADRQRALARAQDVFGARVRERDVGSSDAIEPHTL